ncbi:MAG: PorP/SprF family type IX secretion system membrane protein [Bacteroidota bacterium]
MRSFLVIAICWFGLTPLLGQTNGGAMSFPVDPIAYNPAFTGILERPVFQLQHFGRWSGLEGAPTAQEIGFHTPLPDERVAIGFRGHFNRMGVSQQWTLQANYAYRIQLNEKWRVHFGLSASTMAHRVLYTKLEALHAVDGSLPMVNQSDYQTNFGAGIVVRQPNWYVGVSNPGLIQRRRSNYNAAAFTDFQNEGQSVYYAVAGGQIQLCPQTQLVFSGVLGTGDDWRGRFQSSWIFKDVFWVSAAYHSPDVLDVGFGVQVSNQLRLSLSNLFTFSAVQQFSSHTYGIGLRYVFSNSFPSGETFSFSSQQFLY